MADTSQQQQQQQEEAPEPPQTNGVLDGLTEEEKSKMRPADIDADMREMERRKRVEMMMNSRLFREELERIIETQMKDGSGPSGLLQQISEMMGPQGARFNANVFRNSNCVVPINDIRGVESMGYAKGEKLLRCKLAAVFRLLDLYGWTQGVGGMITARLNQDQEHFLVNPYGLLYHETTASSLVKVDMQGGVVEQGTTNFGVHIASYQLHSTIHAARPDIKCIVHIATPSVTAISATKSGILPLGQESIVIGEVSSHQYISGANLDPEEREKLARNFGPINKVMLLTNRGALCCGETVEEAFYNVYNTVLACETQLKLMPLGVDNLSLITDETRKAMYEASRRAPVPQHSSLVEPSPLAEKLEKRWRIGGTEFEALMRMLDNAGFRTGYIYRHPLVKSEPPRPRNDVEVPPAVSSLGYLLEEEELYKQGLWKGGRKGTDRTRWLNSPNVYQKVEILETGTPDPKKITKWVSDDSPTHSSTPVKIEGALQFVPKNTNPKEFKQLQQQIKDYRRADKISAGPQSHILEGVTWEEAKKMQDATISGAGEQVVLVGAASKGIIQRGFQHNAMVYKTPYAKNPFDAVTDQELDQYKKEIERKTKGDPYDESQSESEALSSFNISRATHESSTAKSPIQSPVSVTSETEEESRDEPKVLRIETKQVPVPSQPEVVLSDERSVEPTVVESPVARREDVRFEQSKALRGTNIKSVNADFLNEQRRSEMMTRRNANGRGVSGVSRLSSVSSINSSGDDSGSGNWPWGGYYGQQPCYLERTRLDRLARPMQALLTDVQTASAIKRRLKKREFFENYEKRFTSSAGKEAKPEADVAHKFENSSGRKSGARRQLRREMDTEVGDVQYVRSTGMDFAEKVHLPVECAVSDGNVSNVHQGQRDDALRSPTIVRMNMRNNNSSESNQIDNDVSSAESSLNSTSDNRVNHKNETFNSMDEFETDTFVQDINDNRNSYIHVNEVEISISNHPSTLHNNDLENSFETDSNENETEVQNKHNEKAVVNMMQSESAAHNLNYENNEEIVNYVNELEIFVENNVTENSSLSHYKQGLEEKSGAHSLSTDEVNNNDSSGENQISNVISSTENSLNSTLKAFSCNESDNNITKEEFNLSNEAGIAENVLDINKNGNNCIYVNELEISICNYSDNMNNDNLERNSPKHKVDTIKNLEYSNKNNIPNANFKFVEIENIYNSNDENSTPQPQPMNYVNELQFFVYDTSHCPDNETSETNKTLDNTSQQSGRNLIEKLDLSSIPDIQNGSDINKSADNTESQANKKDFPVYNHSTPLDVDDIEKNPLDTSLRIFLENEKDSMSEKSLEDVNTTIKDEEELNDLSSDSHNKKSDENGNLCLSIDYDTDSSHFLDDVTEQSKEFFKTVPGCLDFTYSEIDKCSEDFSPASTARSSFFSDDDLVMKRFSRRDSIADVLSSLNADLRPSNQLTVDSLADTENSVKYNLDSQNMSLIYSITPPNDIGDCSKDTTITDILEDNEKDHEACENDSDNEDVIWISSNTDRKEFVNMNKTTELSETSLFSNVSNQGSDLLELPSHTYHDLQKSSDEIFHKNMSSSVNQILTELNDAEVYVNAANFVDEILFDVACLNLPRDVTRYSKLELNNFIKEKIWSLNFAKKLAKDLVGNLPFYDVNNSANSKVSNIDESSRLESLDQSVYVIREIIHHIVDKDSLGKWDFKSKKNVTDKRDKESMNIELKGLKDEYDAADEKSLKCSTPKTLLSPKRSRINSSSEEQLAPDLDNDDENHEVIYENVTASSKSQQSSDTGVSSNSSPSTESQNFAEQEITSESTDNDTKSDNSKEKPTDSGEALRSQSISSTDQLNSKVTSVSPDSPNDPDSPEAQESSDAPKSLDVPETLESQNEEDKPLENALSTVSFCLIEYTNEGDPKFQKESHESITTHETDEDKRDGDTDSDESIKDFMHNFMECQEEINQMWQQSEARLEEMYYTERLDEITDIKEDIIECQEKIRELCHEIGLNASTAIAGIEEQSTSFNCSDDEVDASVGSHVQFERVDETCTCCHAANVTVTLENSKSQVLSPISEEPELESLENNAEHAESTVNSFETLPAIFEQSEFSMSYEDDNVEMSDSRTPEFYSCQNSTSMKSCDDYEITTSTLTVSTDEISDSERAYNADVSANNDAASVASTVVCRSESTISDEANAPNQTAANLTENFADVSSASSRCNNYNNNEEVTLECMTYSYETKEFLKLEFACSSDESSYVSCEALRSSARPHLADHEDDRLCSFVTPVDSLSDRVV